MDELAAGTRRASDASERMGEIRGRSLRLVTALNLLWASVALLGGAVAAVLVRRHQRVVSSSAIQAARRGRCSLRCFPGATW
jgi:hypothetical protein